MKPLTLALTVAIVTFVVACNNASGPTSDTRPSPVAKQTPTPDEFAGARQNFAKNCVLCHGEDAEGGLVKLEDGTRLKVPSLRRGHALNHPEAALAKQITKGGEGMPAFKDKLKPEEIDELVRFIRHELQSGQTPPAQPMKMK